jgi:hypothetical protein
MPTTTPTRSRSAFAPRSPREALSATTATVGAKNESGWSPSRIAITQAVVAAAVPCSSGQALPATRRSPPAPARATRRHVSPLSVCITTPCASIAGIMVMHAAALEEEARADEALRRLRISLGLRRGPGRCSPCGRPWPGCGGSRGQLPRDPIGHPPAPQGLGKVAIRPHLSDDHVVVRRHATALVQAGSQIPATSRFGHWCRP